jgi:hypothetical protein
VSSGLRAFTARSWTMLASIVVVVAAMLAFFITGSPDPDRAAAQTADPEVTPTGEPQAREPKQPQAERREPDKPRKPRRERPAKPSAYVEVFNNSGITGLADAAAGQLSGAGWEVVGTDNWYGDIPATTVYYPPRLKGQATLLADEVGATRIRPAVEPMRFDRLTLILTGDL